MPDRQWGYYPAAKGEALAVELERALESSPPQEQAANGTIDTASDFSSEHRGGIMPVSSTPAVERVARVLWGIKLHQNAEEIRRGSCRARVSQHVRKQMDDG